MAEFSTIWAAILAHQGELFHQKRGGEFRYVVQGTKLVPDRSGFPIPRAHFEKAAEQLPFSSTGDVQGLYGPSYLYAILMDPRIRGSWEGPDKPAPAEVPGRVSHPTGQAPARALAEPPARPQLRPGARTISLRGVVFEAVCDIQPIRDANGRLAEFSPQAQYARATTTRLNRWGAGPFCRFSIPRGWAGAAGVYAILVDGQLRYIGECADLERRFNIGYGNIQPINCFVGGQSTNCKINSFILQAAKAGARVSLFFHPTDDYKRVERELIAAFRPAWNGR